MLDPKIQSALNDHLQAELASSYLYLSMAAFFEAANLQGSAQWMRRQAQEEAAHAMKVFEYVVDRSGRVELKALAAPPGDFGSTAGAWTAALQNEQKVSRFIGDLYARTREAGDHATHAMLQWFVTEQVEEEKTVESILQQVKQIGENSTAMFFLDRHLGKAAEKGE
jgi:ferritin